MNIERSSGRAGLVVAAVLVLVVGVWFGARAWPRGPESVTEPSPARPVTEPEALGGTRGSADAEAGPADVASNREEERTPAPSVLGRAIVLEGRITDRANGTGIEGVEVAPPGNWLGPPTVHSDEAGRFSMPCSPIAPPELVIRPPVGWSPTTLRLGLDEEQRRGVGQLSIEFTRLPEGTFQVHIVDEATGEPLPDFQFMRRGRGVEHPLAQTDEFGWAQVESLDPSERWSLLDWIDGSNTTRPVAEVSSVLAGAEGNRLSLRAEVGPTYALTLEGWQLDDVSILRGYLASRVSRVPIEEQSGAPAPVRTGADGPWIRLAPRPRGLLRAEPGEASWLVLTCAEPSLRGVARVEDLVGRAPGRVLVRLAPAVHLAGRVTARDGSTIPGVRLHFLVEAGEGAERRVTFTDDHGAYELAGVPPDASAVHVTAFVKGFNQATQELTPFAEWETEGARRDLVLDSQDASASIAGRVEGAVDHLEHTKITVTNIGPPFALPRTVELAMDATGEGGAFRVDGIPPGSYRVDVAGWTSIEFTPSQLEVVAPADGLRIEASARSEKRGSVLARCSGEEPRPGTAWLLRGGEQAARSKRFYCGVEVWSPELLRPGDQAVLALFGHQPVVTSITPQLLQSGDPSWWIDAEGPRGWGAIVCATAAGAPVVGLEIRSATGDFLGVTDGAGIAFLAAEATPPSLEFGSQGWRLSGVEDDLASVATRAECEFVELKLEVASGEAGGG